ncbi:MAG TPA: protein kinase [Candidatus Methylomirabilis sp.]|nr:protein kinase [Candidatus Methylomirabilis sp.]
MYCSSCGAQVSSNGRFCSTCGSSLDINAAATIDSEEVAGNQETIAPPSTPRKPPSSPTPTRQPRTPSSGGPSPTSSDPIGGGRFAPGQMIAGRYRVVSLAGRGGMGEVYRAEDLTLGQIVAIKFLPEALSQDEAVLSRFHSEVRVARQVSHPNVCRVFDIGDADGAPFLSMEYVDGEDLASVVRRIGRLSPERATEIARQICAGLAAAHERGVIHRDLKPANVMLDNSGKIRITDFGLAGLAASIQGADVRAGTPAYMAPEQLAGKEVTPKSDIYSLGLILYEILTGKRAFEASTLPELIKLREQRTITNPSTLVRDLDPLIERVILRCLEKDPAHRPASALKVAAALPGGDPLAAALAAGETPSPEMVAAAGEKEGMRPRSAVTLLAIAVAGLLAFPFIGERLQIVNRASLENPPDVLIARARDIIAKLAIPGIVADSAAGFDADNGYLRYIEKHDATPSRWKVLSEDRPSFFTFWYRQSPHTLDPREFFGSGFGGGSVTPDDPPVDRTGMVSLVLDSRGRLLHLEAVQPQKDPPQSPQAPNWSALFSAAGLDLSSFKSSEPEWTSLEYADSRAAWTGTLPGHSELPVRVEAAAYHGAPVYFDLLFPWSKADRDAPDTRTRAEDAGVIMVCLVFFLILIGGALVARWNLKQGRADQKGAARLCAFVFLATLAFWALQAHHVADIYELSIFLIAIAWALLLAFFVLIPYVALEPFVRRREPHILISWTRLLAGGFRDPLVGRDLLVGVVYGIAIFLFNRSDNILLPLFGKLPPAPGGVSTDTLSGVHVALGDLLFLIVFYTLYALCIFFLLFLLQRLLRKTWLAVIAVAAIGAFLSLNTGGEHPAFAATELVVLYVSFLLVLKRFGLLPLVVGLVVQNVLAVFPATIHLSRWYAASGLTGFGAIALLTVYSFHTALAGQRLFSMETIDR